MAVAAADLATTHSPARLARSGGVSGLKAGFCSFNKLLCGPQKTRWPREREKGKEKKLAAQLDCCCFVCVVVIALATFATNNLPARVGDANSPLFIHCQLTLNDLISDLIATEEGSKLKKKKIC